MEQEKGLTWNEKCHVLLLILVFLPKCLGGLNSGQVISAGKRVQSSDEQHACLQVRGSKKVPRPEDLHYIAGWDQNRMASTSPDCF